MINNQDIHDLENKAMTLLLNGDYPVLRILYEQWLKSSKVSIKFTGVGFFINYSVPFDIPRVDNAPSFTIGDVDANLEGLEYPIGFILFVRDGKLACLEGYSNENKWPDKIKINSIFYSPGPNRDWSALKKRINF